jgi:hypothetical protein
LFHSLILVVGVKFDLAGYLEAGKTVVAAVNKHSDNYPFEDLGAREH